METHQKISKKRTVIGKKKDLGKNSRRMNKHKRLKKSFKPTFSKFGGSLPIFSHKDEITAALAEPSSGLIICGQTGCGKTTQVPKYILEAGLSSSKMIAVTQPRRVAAVTIAQRVAHELGSSCGQTVGYSVRFDKRVSDDTKICYLTDGMLLREAILDPTLSKFGVIILDEVHERTVSTDVLMAIVKKLRETRDLKVIVMSATIDIPKISEYFGIDKVVSVKGRTYPVEIYNLKQPEGNYVDNAMISILQTHLEHPEGDILCFLTGQEDIEDLQSLLEEKIELGKHPDYNMAPLVVVPLYANLPNHLQLRAFEKCEGRKVILATNIAETSVTINGIRYIIDSGLCKMKSFQTTTGVDTLKITAISKNSATQRSGRAGREAPGKCFRLYTEEIYDEMCDSTPPEIFRTNLSRVIIQLKAMGIKDVSDFDFIDKPSKQLYINAFKELNDLRCLDADANLNELGRKMSIIPTEPVYSKLLIHSTKTEYKNISKDIVIIVAMLSVENIFYAPRNFQRKAERKHKKFFVLDSDHLTLLNVYNYYIKNKGNSGFCKENFINEKSLKKATQITNQLLGYLKTLSQKSDDTVEETKAEVINELDIYLTRD